RQPATSARWRAIRMRGSEATRPRRWRRSKPRSRMRRRRHVMPLRDHFHAPLDDETTWEPFHGGWPMVIAQHLNRILPSRYVAGPRVHRGAQIEIDVAAYERDEPGETAADAGNGTAYAPSQPTVAVETELLSTDEYEVRVYDVRRRRRL